MAAHTPAPLPGPKACRRIPLFGFAASVLAYAVLLINISSAIFITMTGINNRVLIAVALGVTWALSAPWLGPDGSFRALFARIGFVRE